MLIIVNRSRRLESFGVIYLTVLKQIRNVVKRLLMPETRSSYKGNSESPDPAGRKGQHRGRNIDRNIDYHFNMVLGIFFSSVMIERLL